jgi:hypothetical protein
MVGVSRVLLSFALIFFALFAGQSPGEFPHNQTSTEKLRDANLRDATREAGGLSVPMAKINGPLVWAGEASPAKEPNTSAEKSPSVIQMLEGRESDLLVWLSIAIVFFMIGWILGGNYYLRRDRVRRRKLRF